MLARHPRASLGPFPICSRPRRRGLTSALWEIRLNGLMVHIQVMIKLDMGIWPPFYGLFGPQGSQRGEPSVTVQASRSGSARRKKQGSAIPRLRARHFAHDATAEVVELLVLCSRSGARKANSKRPCTLRSRQTRLFTMQLPKPWQRAVFAGPDLSRSWLVTEPVSMMQTAGKQVSPQCWHSAHSGTEIYQRCFPCGCHATCLRFLC